MGTDYLDLGDALMDQFRAVVPVTPDFERVMRQVFERLHNDVSAPQASAATVQVITTGIPGQGDVPAVESAEGAFKQFSAPVYSGQPIRTGHLIHLDKNGFAHLAISDGTQVNSILKWADAICTGVQTGGRIYYRCGGTLQCLLARLVASGSRLYLSATTAGCLTDDPTESGKVFTQDCGLWTQYVTPRPTVAPYPAFVQLCLSRPFSVPATQV